MRNSTKDATIRTARVDDAPAISALYRQAYKPAGEGDARENYPFPQFLEPGWVAAAVVREEIRWLVAECDGQVVGTVGAVLNIGSDDDRVTESFGLVISERWRGHGTGARLFGSLCDSLDQEVRFIIGETRTAHPGGWKIVRRHGFAPIGFEPFAHVTPAGSEPMLLTGRVQSATSGRRKLDCRPLASVRSLARAVLNALQLPPLAAPLPAEEFRPLASPEDLWPRLVATDSSLALAPLELSDAEREFQVARDDGLGKRLLEVWSAGARHGSGVIGLHHLEGEDSLGSRYDRQYFIGTISGRPVCCARLVLDRRDCRLRILEVQTLFGGLPELLIGGILREIELGLGTNPLSVVIDIRADMPGLQAALERLNFFPTAYYPALVSDGPSRIDGVQYTRLFHLNFVESLAFVNNLDWAAACNVVREVSALARSSQPADQPAASLSGFLPLG